MNFMTLKEEQKRERGCGKRGGEENKGEEEVRYSDVVLVRVGTSRIAYVLLGQEYRLQARLEAPNISILVFIPTVGAVLEVEAENNTTGSLGLNAGGVYFHSDLEFEVF